MWCSSTRITATQQNTVVMHWPMPTMTTTKKKIMMKVKVMKMTLLQKLLLTWEIEAVELSHVLQTSPHATRHYMEVIPSSWPDTVTSWQTRSVHEVRKYYVHRQRCNQSYAGVNLSWCTGADEVVHYRANRRSCLVAECDHAHSIVKFMLNV